MQCISYCDNLYYIIKVEAPKHGNSAVGVTVGALLDSSTGISDKVGEWHLGFEFSPSSAAQSSQPGLKRESNESGAGLTLFNQSFGKLANAHSWPESNQTLVGLFNIVSSFYVTLFRLAMIIHSHNLIVVFWY
jgi:hypothetical protein